MQPSAPWTPSAPPAPDPNLPAWAQPGPLGKTRSIVVVVILYIVTLSIYRFVWSWRVTKELDAFSPTPKPSHPVYRKSIWFLLAGIVPLILGFAIIVATVGLQNLRDDPNAVKAVVRDAAGAILAGVLLILVGAGLLIASAVFGLVAMFHFTRNLEASVKRFVGSDSVSATTLFVLFLLGDLAGRYGGQILTLVAMCLSQVGLNKLWAGPAAMAAPPPPRM